MDYLKRAIDDQLQDYLDAGATERTRPAYGYYRRRICIYTPRWGQDHPAGMLEMVNNERLS